MSEPTPSYRAYLRELARTDDGAFAEYVTGRPFPAHLRGAFGFVERERNRQRGRDEAVRSAILLPRGHGKTTGALAYLARQIGLTRGERNIAIITADRSSAADRSRELRSIVASPAFAEVFPWAARGLAARPWRESAWSVAGPRAGRKETTVRALSLPGLRPGHRFDLVLADDIVGPAESATAAGRAKTRERFSAVLEPMLTEDGEILAIGTHWNSDDIYASLAARGWPTFLRPALDPAGNALWPEIWPAARLAAKRREMGSALFDLQYQNDPSGMGGNVFRADWFRPIDALPGGLTRRAGLDLAASASERSDYTAYVEIAEDAAHNLYVLGAFRDRLDEGHRAWLTGYRDGERVAIGTQSPRLLWPAGDLPSSWQVPSGDPASPRRLSALNIESVAYQSTFVTEMLSTTRLPARKVYPEVDKVARARAIAARYEAGRIFHLRGAPGIAELEAELVAFPNGGHDDLVDALGYAADLGGVDLYFTSGRR